MSSVYDEIANLRRDIHAHPELAFQESRTARIVGDWLDRHGIAVHEGIGGTGVVGVLRKGSSAKSVMLRADMDALPILEENTFSHKSCSEGVMHACGHDGHTAILLGAARQLSRDESFDGTVYFVFQPAEENGHAGARAMIEAGLFERFPCDAIFGMHNWPELPAGEIGSCPGPLMAGGVGFRIEIFGKGGHAATPHFAIDPVPVLGELIQSLQTILTRSVRANDAAVVSITQVAAGGVSRNIIADNGTLGGTVRAFRAGVIDQIEARMLELATNTARAHRCEAELEFRRSYPPVVNSAREFELCIEVARDLVGRERALVLDPVMASEDFAFYLQRKPGCFFFMGSGAARDPQSQSDIGPCGLHNPGYDFNDDIIPLGVEFWSRLAKQFLAKEI